MSESELSARSVPTSAEKSSSIAPLRNAETFAVYCAEIQSRLAEHAVRRRQFLQEAHEKLTSLLFAAHAVEDEALSGELKMRLTAVTELLASLENRSVPVTGAFSPSPRPIKSSFPAAASEMQNGYRPDFSPSPASGSEPSLASGNEPPSPRLPRRPVRPLPDIEAEAIQMRGELHEWNEAHSLVPPGGGLDVPNALRLRAIACRQRRLEEEAGDTEVAEVTELGEDIEAIMDDAGDEEYTVALDYELDPLPTAYQWGELADRYSEMAEAYHAFEWWNRNWADLTVQEVQPLAEAVAAIQQRFNRLLFRIGARDPYQQILFDDLRTWAREAQCYLHSLRPKVPIAELIERATTMKSAWENAQKPVQEARVRGRLLDRLEQMTGAEMFGEAGIEDELRLHELLLECREAKIPASDRRLREALLPWAFFLEGEDRFRDYLREVNLEWERRQDTARPEETELEPPEALLPLQEELEAVREVTRGLRFLLLGGLPRQDIQDKIQDTMQFSEVKWLPTRPEEVTADFTETMHTADAVGIFTRFSRKEWNHVEEKCRREGRKFWRFTSRYRISQLVKTLYKDEVTAKS